MLLPLALAATWYMVGLVWFVQAVAYPQFARVGPAEFAAYHRSHMTFTGLVVLPPMVLELATSLLLVRAAPTSPLFQTALALNVLIWLNTFAMAVPLHRRLSTGHDPLVIRRLVRANWIRSIAWTGKGVLLLWAVISSGNP